MPYQSGVLVSYLLREPWVFLALCCFRAWVEKGSKCCRFVLRAILQCALIYGGISSTQGQAVAVLGAVWQSQSAFQSVGAIQKKCRRISDDDPWSCICCARSCVIEPTCCCFVLRGILQYAQIYCGISIIHRQAIAV